MQIYKITNLINNKIYIGQDTKNDIDYFGSGLLINKAIKKYGKENFIKEILEDNVEFKEKLNELEKYWIKELNSQDKNIGYNISNGGDGGDVFTNNPNKEEIRKKLSKAISLNGFIERYGDVIGNEKWNDFCKSHSRTLQFYIERYGEVIGTEKYNKYVQNCSNAQKGEKNGMYNHIYTDETRKKMSESSKNKSPMTELTKSRISKSNKGRKLTKQQCENKSKALKGRKGLPGEKNPMYGKPLMELWTEKYGIDEANRREFAKNEKHKKTLEKKKLEKLLKNE